MHTRCAEARPSACAHRSHGRLPAGAVATMMTMVAASPPAALMRHPMAAAMAATSATNSGGRLRRRQQFRGAQKLTMIATWSLWLEQSQWEPYELPPQADGTAGRGGTGGSHHRKGGSGMGGSRHRKPMAATCGWSSPSGSRTSFLDGPMVRTQKCWRQGILNTNGPSLSSPSSGLFHTCLPKVGRGLLLQVCRQARRAAAPTASWGLSRCITWSSGDGDLFGV